MRNVWSASTLPARSTARYVTIVVPWLKTENDVKPPGAVVEPVCGPVSAYEIAWTPAPPASSCAVTLTWTLDLCHPLPLGGGASEWLDVGGVMSPDRIDIRPAAHPAGVQPVEFVTQRWPSGSEAKKA